MGTYDHQKLLSDWSVGKITNDQATGHLLQHLGLVYQALSEAGQKRHALRNEVESLKATLTTLKREQEPLRRQVARLQKENQRLTELQATVSQLKDEVDSLVNPLAKE